MKLSEFSVKNSLLINCLSIFLLVAGILSLLNTEREAFPNFTINILTITTNYPGASPEVIEKRITLPLEKELKDVEDIDEMDSISVEGISIIILKLDPDVADANKTYMDIQKAVDRTQDLPEDLTDNPSVYEFNTKNAPLVEISLSGDLPEKELRKLALYLETELLDLKGVAAVVRKGLRDQEIWVEIHQKKMEDFYLSIPQVIQALARRNVNVPGGSLKGTTKEFLLRTSGELENAEDVKSVILRANDEGHWVAVGDIATVSEKLEELKTLQRTDGTRAINLLVVKEDAADAIRLKASLDQLVKQFQEKSPAELKLAFINDFSFYIKRRLGVLTSNGWIGLILVIITLASFLSFRVTIGAVIGIPIALCATLTAMKLMGISINLISMFGMILVLGMMVDEDVVIAENISRHLEAGLPHQEAAIRGTTEVAKPLLATVLTTIIAFVPLLFMSGIMGKYVSTIPKVVIITLCASLLQALIILPSHLSDLHRPFGNQPIRKIVKRKSHHLFDWLRKQYNRSLKFCLRHSVATSFVSLFMVALFFLYAFLGLRYGLTNARFVLFPSKGIEAFFIRAEGSPGTPLEVTENKMMPIEKQVASLPSTELDHFITQIGIVQNDPGDPFTKRGSHLGQIVVFLTPQKERVRETETIMEAFRSKFNDLSGFEKIHIDPIKPGPPTGKPIAIQIRGNDYQELINLSSRIQKQLDKVGGVVDILDDYEEGKGELHIQVDEKKAYQSGLTVSGIANTVRFAFEGGLATTIRKGDEEIDVVVRFDEKLRYGKKALEDLLIANASGDLIPLKRVASIGKATGVSAIKHLDGKRVITVTANIDEAKTTSAQVNQKMREYVSSTLQKDHPGVTFNYGGEAKDTDESLQGLKRAFLIAILCIFLLLLITFGHLSQTLALLFIIPFGAVGVILGFAVLNEPYSFLALLGGVGLTGIAVDGGILLFTFINQFSKKNTPIFDKIVSACDTRFRPILLTTVTTVLAVVPAAYGIGGTDPFIRPMALAMNWGLAFVLFFTLYAIPCLYYVVEKTCIQIQELVTTRINKK